MLLFAHGCYCCIVQRMNVGGRPLWSEIASVDDSLWWSDNFAKNFQKPVSTSDKVLSGKFGIGMSDLVTGYMLVLLEPVYKSPLGSLKRPNWVKKVFSVVTTTLDHQQTGESNKPPVVSLLIVKSFICSSDWSLRHVTSLPTPETCSKYPESIWLLMLRPLAHWQSIRRHWAHWGGLLQSDFVVFNWRGRSSLSLILTLHRSSIVRRAVDDMGEDVWIETVLCWLDSVDVGGECSLPKNVHLYN